MPSNFRIGVAHDPTSERKLYTKGCFERVFDLNYLDHLRCQTWRLEKWIQKRGAYLYKNDLVAELPRWLGTFHKNEIEHPETEHLTIRWISADIGYGLYTEKTIPAWSYVGEYAGLLRPRGLFRRDINDYCFMYPYLGYPWKPLTVDSEKWGNHTRFINHSDFPNLESYSFFYKGMFRLGFRALREIAPGEELSYDYGDIYWLHRKKL